MKKHSQYKNFIIAEKTKTEETYNFYLYTKDEWAYGNGYRQVEWECDSIEEAKQWIDCY